MENLLDALLNWVETHPHWAGITLMLVAGLESFLVVGLFVPGVAIMFGVGAMIASGHLPLVPALAWSTLGAVVGDGTSYLIGRHYHQRLRVVWPFNKHPDMMARGIDFFHRHGGKSVFLGRFVGPMRALVPAIAGMVDMPVVRFFAADLLSAAIWVPVYMAPGMLFGASLKLAAEATGRLALLIALVFVVVWFSWWLVHRVARGLQPHATALLLRILDWSRHHPRFHPLAASLLDPDHPEARGLSLLALMLIAASWLFLITLQHLTPGTLLGNLDLYFNNLMQDLRTTWADLFFIRVTELGRSALLYAFTAMVSLWLVWRRRWRAALHWLITVASVGVLTYAIKLATAVSRPNPALDAIIDHSFPSAHTSVATAVFGFLAVLIARELQPNRRWIPYSLATLLIVLTSFSRLYLGAHWFSDIVGGFSLGLVWVALMGIAYRRHPAPALSLLRFIPVVAAAAIASVLIDPIAPGRHQPALYTTSAPVVQISETQWMNGGWRDAPAFRNDLRGNHSQPLDLQWKGDLQAIEKRLDASGWKKPVGLSGASLFQSFTSRPPAESLPLMPQIHEGREQALMRYRTDDDAARLLVLRLWPSTFVVGEKAVPLWVGNVSYVQPVSPMFLFTLLKTGADFDAALRASRAHLPDLVADVRREAAGPNLPEDLFLLVTNR
jgi:undecaprenyl-diphosphatase